MVTHERKYSITFEEVGITDVEPESLPHDSNLRRKMHEVRDFGRYDNKFRSYFSILYISF